MTSNDFNFFDELSKLYKEKYEEVLGNQFRGITVRWSLPKTCKDCDHILKTIRYKTKQGNKRKKYKCMNRRCKGKTKIGRELYD